MVLYEVCSNYAPGAKIGPTPGLGMGGKHREKHEKNFLSETIRPRTLIFGVWTSTKFVQIMPLGSRMLYIGLYWGKHEKIILSETIKHRALIFGM